MESDQTYRKNEWWWRFGSPHPDMRVSDAERSDIAEVLSRHFADGRLDREEFDERLAKAMGAKTRGDLAGLLADLPRLDAPAPAPAPHRAGWIGRFVVVAIAVVIATHLTVDAFTPHIPWFLIVVVLVVLVGRGGFRRHGRRTT